VSTASPTRRALPALALLTALAALAMPAAAQIVGVPQAPPRPAAVRADSAADSVPRRPPVDRDTLLERQRLDIQAWVDSAAPALAAAPRPSPAAATEVPRVDPPVSTPPAPRPPAAGTVPRRPSAESGRRPPTGAPR
jgi:hypothetical protein